MDADAYVKAVLGNDEIATSFSTPRNDENKPWKILLEYMSGNPNKPLHVGHARNVCIGDTLRRTFLQQ